MSGLSAKVDQLSVLRQFSSALSRAMAEICCQVHFTLSRYIHQKRFKKGSRFLPNIIKKKFGLRIARNFYRFSILPLQIASWWHQAISPKVITLFSGRDISHTMKHKNEDDRFAPASSFLCKADKLPYESRYNYL